jgi:hypothetical protein
MALSLSKNLLIVAQPFLPEQLTAVQQAVANTGKQELTCIKKYSPNLC